MKYITPLILLFLGSFKVFSQHSSLVISNTFKIKEGDYKNQTVAHSVYYNNSFYTVTNSGVSPAKWLFTRLYDIKFSIAVTQYDKDMKVTREVVLGDGKREFGPLMPSLLTFNNKLYVAYFKAVDKASYTFYLARLNENDLSLGEGKPICTIQQENVGLFKVESIVNQGIIFFAISPDDTRLMVACKSAPGKVQTVMLDNGLNLLNQATIPVSQSSFDIPSAVLTNDNGMCLILHSDEGSSILSIGPGGEKTEIAYNAIGQVFADRVRAQLARDGKSIIIYSIALPSRKSSSSKGFILSRLDVSTFKLSNPIVYEFTPDFVQWISEKGGGYEHKKEYFINNFTPQLLEMKNGDLAIIGSPEETAQSMTTSAPNMQGRTQTIDWTTLTVGSILVCFPGNDGKITDEVAIPRKIVLTRASGSGTGAIRLVEGPHLWATAAGFVAAEVGDDIAIIYNDNTKNLSQSINEKVAVSTSPGDLELVEGLISKDRKLEYRKLIGELHKYATTFYLGQILPSNSSTIVFPIGRQGEGFNANKMIYTNWCFLQLN